MPKSTTKSAKDREDEPLCFFGVDPGITGAIAFSCQDGDCLDGFTVFNVPCTTKKKGKTRRKEIDIPALFQRVKELAGDKRVIIFFEDVHSMPKQGVVSTFRFGEARGILLAVFSLLNSEIVLVPTREWKKSLNLSQDKKDSLLRASQLFPDINIANHNQAEALLILYYGFGKYKL